MRLNQLIFTIVFALAAISLVTGSHAHETKIGNLSIFHPWSRQPLPASAVAAGFMKITNTGSEDDRLVKATATISDTVQIHEMSMDNGVMKMGELTDGLVIPAGATVEFKPGSYHMMFIGLKEKPVEGTAFAGTLTFEKAGTVDISYDVEAPNAGMN
jgi:copper(I)-binding protein